MGGVQNWYGNLSELGKCYTVSALGSSGDRPYKEEFLQVRRHYTITNCLRREFY